VAVLLALAAALFYGAADFCGGVATKRTTAVAVVVVSQLIGSLVLAAALPFVPGRFTAEVAWWGLLGGFCAAVVVTALYAALAVGRMGVVSPITAVLGASVPVLAGLALGERPAPLAGAGIALAAVAIVLFTLEPQTGRFSLAEPGVRLALLSGLALGALYTILGRAPSGGGLGLLASIRVSSVALLAGYALARKQSLRPARGGLPAIAAAGVLDMSANLFYVLAAQRGLLAIVAVLSSLYPAATVFLARLVLRERLNAFQWCGVACACCGVALIAGT
jgi:drug/metabolite transporter (DMT)-like permease